MAPSGSPATETTATGDEQSATGEQKNTSSVEISEDPVGSAPSPKKTDAQDESPNWFSSNWAWLMAGAVLVAVGGTIAYIKFCKKGGESEAEPK